jgi:predicted phosphodiesterase
MQAIDYEGRLLINPGSATGAYSALSSAPVTPSFVLMDLDGAKVRLAAASL